MGVRGLTTFVEGNRHFLHDVKFRDSPLVIDGCALYYRLYFNHYLDQQYGGDYDAFSRLLNEFLSALAACNIQPYVVLDGGMDPSDKKFSTLKQRLQSKIKEADNIAHGRNGCVLPILTREVFIEVLTQREIPLFQCSAEADLEIACLAHQWNCPVLTNDSDFYIYDLPGGYLPFNFFQWTNLRGTASQRHIPARRFTTNSLCRWFGGMNKELLPLCAILAGNDYGVPKDAETLLDLLDVNCLSGKGKSHIEGLLLWLSSFSSPGEALEEVNRLMGDGGGGRGNRGGKGRLSSRLWAGMQEYHITPHSPVVLWFSGGKTAPGTQVSSFAQLPECLSQAAARGLLAPLVMDVLVMQRVLLIPQVENSKLTSSHSCSQAIRQALYGILLQRGVQPSASKGTRGRGGRRRGGGQVGAGMGRGHTQFGEFAEVSHGQALTAGAVHSQTSGISILVEEHDRLDLSLIKKQVEVQPLRVPLCLDTLVQASPPVRLGGLLEVLGVSEPVLASIAPHLRLAVAVTAYWLREASPHPSKHQLQALLLGMVHGELNWSGQPGAASHHPINWAEERRVRAALDRQRMRPGQRQSLDVGDAHSFSQWQTCLWSALFLNQLLLLPLPAPHLSWLFSGTLVHGLLLYLKGGRPAENLVAGGSYSAQLYSLLLNSVKNCSSHTQPRAASRGKRRGSRGRRGQRRGGRGTAGVSGELANKFALLMNEEGFDDW